MQVYKDLSTRPRLSDQNQEKVAFRVLVRRKNRLPRSADPQERAGTGGGRPER